MLCADMFSGAGGMSAGFRMAGFRSAMFNEMDAAAVGAYSANFPESRAYAGPVQELSADSIKRGCPAAARLDVLCGGPPCQGFSVNAPSRSDGDPRNHLFRHYVRLVEGLAPRFVVMENVPGLLSMSGGATIKAVMGAFAGAGYGASAMLLNAAHYGVPQERWRLFIVAARGGMAVPGSGLFPRPTHYSTGPINFTTNGMYFQHAVSRGTVAPAGLLPPVTVAEAIGDLSEIPSGGGAPETPYRYPPASEHQRNARKGHVGPATHHVCSGLSPINLRRIAHVGPGGSWRDIPHALLPKGMQRARRSDHTRRYGRLDPDGPSGTVLTKCDPHWGTVVHYAQDRVISVREAARIQSFHDSFRFNGSKTNMYRQVGNAVPPLLAHALARHIASILGSIR